MTHEAQASVGRMIKRPWHKVTGRKKYTGDFQSKPSLQVKILTSTHGHAIIKNIDTSKARAAKGVKAVITGQYWPQLLGPVIKDRPVLAKDKVRYLGEPVALVVADKADQAQAAAELIEVEYEALPLVNSIKDAIDMDASLVHKDLGLYSYPSPEIQAVEGSNISNRVKIRRGNMEEAWKASDLVVEYEFTMPQSDHLARESKNLRAEISPDGRVHIDRSSQGSLEESSGEYSITEGQLVANPPLLEGTMSGKTWSSLDYLAYLASHAVAGKMVTITSAGHGDTSSGISKLGVEGKVKLGATKEGEIKALECIYFVDCGAYANTGPNMARALATDCSGPYDIKNIDCDSFSIYTNHTYATPYEGFGQEVTSFALEMAINKLARQLKMDPLEVRRINAFRQEGLSSRKGKISPSNIGDLEKCIASLKLLMDWDGGQRRETQEGNIISKGISCFRKTSTNPGHANSGIILTCNKDGSINVRLAGRGIGPGMKTTIGKIVAEKMKISTDDVYVYMDLEAGGSHRHWKTLTSMTNLMLANAAGEAAEDLIRQLKDLAGGVLGCLANDLQVENGKVFLKSDRTIYLKIKDLAGGYQYKNSGELVGRGNWNSSALLPLDKTTSKEQFGKSWTVGAQGVEIEYNPKTHSYRLVKAVTVVDVGKIINPKMARAAIMAGMSMGFALATMEECIYNKRSILEDTYLRTYKLMHFGDQPRYIVDFIESPQTNGPFGARGIGQHGILGIPAAFASAVEVASKEEFHQLPISPDLICKAVREGKCDAV